MSRPLLSIIIPTYNSAPLVIKCLESLEQQTAHKSTFEVVVINDGSTDNTMYLLKKYAQESALNLKILSQSQSGPAIARNQGAAYAQAQWIAFLDSDILASPEWVERGITLIIQHPEAGGFEGRTETCDKERITPFTHQTLNRHGRRYPTCNLIIKKSLCAFCPDYKIPFREDTDLAFTILESGYEIPFDEQLLVFHPPLNAQYLRPIRLAMRYYYDGLLEKRFPEKYKKDVDVHYVLRRRIPHLRKKIYSGFVCTQGICLLVYLLGTYSRVIVGMVVGLHLLNYIAVILTHTKDTDISRLRPREFAALVLITYIVPWVMLIQRIRGQIAFRHHPVFLPHHVSPPPLLSLNDNVKVIPLRFFANNKSHRTATAKFSQAN